MPTRKYKVTHAKRKLPLRGHLPEESTSKKRKTDLAQKTQRKVVKKTRGLVLGSILETILSARKENGGKTPHRFVQNIVDSHSKSCPWLTRHVIMKQLSSLETTKQEQHNLEIVHVAARDETSTIQNPNVP